MVPTPGPDISTAALHLHATQHLKTTRPGVRVLYGCRIARTCTRDRSRAPSRAICCGPNKNVRRPCPPTIAVLRSIWLSGWVLCQKRVQSFTSDDLDLRLDRLSLLGN
jgi:ribosome modulation factor